ncbi:MAG TPA: hypothetical protein P5278_01700 [Patescibacteria group bacterium]|nr:hypothetical protein [bacterium]HRS73191.1 hypothetical protein [Patescibacteria group bacterium]HRT11164.1 hypothetical protein [Patescibacteria group bacterium]HRU90161.1 hypothetical protein [Patescibacteria group bacterium]
MKNIYDQETLEAYLVEFLTMPPIVVAEFNRPSNYKILTDLAAEYKVNLDIVVLLVAINRVSMDELDQYLVDNLDLDRAKASELATKMRDNFFLPIINKIAFLSSQPSPEDYEIIENIFAKQLLNEINADPILIKALNQKIFAWLSEDLDGAKRRIENAMLKNQEIVTKEKITMNDDKLPGTIGNWLHCFTAEKGAANFDSLSISEFLSLSPNTTHLTVEEKKKLSIVLNTYRNIKFFPDSMPSDDGSGWAIIPLPVVEPSSQASKPKEEGSPEVSSSKSDIESPQLSSDSDRENKINQLQLLLKRYGTDTIEGQAIMEEIAKLKGS